MNASRIARALLLAAPLVASLTSATPLAAQGAAPHAEAITASRMRADLMYLAGDGFRGRLTDTPENALALEWIKARFEWLGLAPRGSGGSFFAPYNLITSTLGTTNELSVDWGTATSRHVVGGDFHPRFHSATARASGAVAFVGFGISAPALQHDDLAGDVDFLILGTRPIVPPPPPPGADIAVLSEWQRLDRMARRYDDLFNKARDSSIPVLNQNRLFYLIGQ